MKIRNTWWYDDGQEILKVNDLIVTHNNNRSSNCKSIQKLIYSLIRVKFYIQKRREPQFLKLHNKQKQQEMQEDVSVLLLHDVMIMDKQILKQTI
jgi:hypothetical protein